MRHEIRWTEESETHIARHGIEATEVEVAAYTGLRFTTPGREGTRLVFGTTNAGRHLLIVLAEGLDGSDYCVTAREMTDSERRLFRRKAA